MEIKIVSNIPSENAPGSAESEEDFICLSDVAISTDVYRNRHKRILVNLVVKDIVF
jgi:hypothetical protein